MPVAVTKSQDAVYRAVGKPGVVLIGEGPQSRTRRMLEEILAQEEEHADELKDWLGH